MDQQKYIATLTIVRYPSWAIPFALFSMAIFRLPLWLNKSISFSKLMGSGKNGTFDKRPDWRQWAILTVHNKISFENTLPPAWYGKFIYYYWHLCKCKAIHYLLEPLEGHGVWDGKQAFGPLPKQTEYSGEIAVLTRATIRLKKLKNFWAHVGGAAHEMAEAEGFVTSYGIGEIPWIKQATFSIWKSKEHMRNFAYKMKGHAEVVRKTRKENWYSEEMFVRFRIIGFWKGSREEEKK